MICFFLSNHSGPSKGYHLNPNAVKARSRAGIIQNANKSPINAVSVCGWITSVGATKPKAAMTVRYIKLAMDMAGFVTIAFTPP